MKQVCVLPLSLPSPGDLIPVEDHWLESLNKTLLPAESEASEVCFEK